VISGDFIADVSSYELEEFPELKVNSITAKIFQGRNETISGKIPASYISLGSPTPETLEVLFFDQGEKS